MTKCIFLKWLFPPVRMPAPHIWVACAMLASIHLSAMLSAWNAFPPGSHYAALTSHFAMLTAHFASRAHEKNWSVPISFMHSFAHFHAPAPSSVALMRFHLGAWGLRRSFECPICPAQCSRRASAYVEMGLKVFILAIPCNCPCNRDHKGNCK